MDAQRVRTKFAIVGKATIVSKDGLSFQIKILTYRWQKIGSRLTIVGHVKTLA